MGSHISKFLRPSPYHLVPKHLRATWPRPEQSHLLPEACSPNGTDNRQQRQRRTKRPPPEPSDILKRFYALYDDKLRYYMKKMFNLNCVLNPFLPTVPQLEHSILAKIAKKFGQKWVKDDLYRMKERKSSVDQPNMLPLFQHKARINEQFKFKIKKRKHTNYNWFKLNSNYLKILFFMPKNYNWF